MALQEIISSHERQGGSWKSEVPQYGASGTDGNAVKICEGSGLLRAVFVTNYHASADAWVQIHDSAATEPTGESTRIGTAFQVLSGGDRVVSLFLPFTKGLWIMGAAAANGSITKTGTLQVYVQLDK